MKTVCRIILLFFGLYISMSCRKDDEPALVDITGEWKLVTLNGAAISDIFEDEALDVFLSFSGDGTFETFQRRLGSEVFVRYYGSWNVSGTTADGTYSDGQPWGASYEVSVEDDGQILNMTSDMEFCTYIRAEVLESIRENAIDYTLMTKAGFWYIPERPL